MSNSNDGLSDLIITCFEDLASIKVLPEDVKFADASGTNWTNVPDAYYADRYLISDQGDTWSVKWHSVMNNSCNENGYYSVNLCKDSKVKRVYISRLVLLAFGEDTPENWEELQANHKDEDRSNNCISNLNWLTPKENINWGEHNKKSAESRSGQHRTEEQKEKMGEAHKGKGTVKVISVNLEDNSYLEWDSIREAAAVLGVDPGNISACCRGKRYSLNGYTFKYKEA